MWNLEVNNFISYKPVPIANDYSQLIFENISLHCMQEDKI